MAIFGYDAQQPCKKKDEQEILSLKTLLKNNAPADETHNRHAGMLNWIEIWRIPLPSATITCSTKAGDTVHVKVTSTWMLEPIGSQKIIEHNVSSTSCCHLSLK